MKRFLATTVILALVMPLSGFASGFQIVKDPTRSPIEITKIYQPYYTSISEKRATSQATTYIPVVVPNTDTQVTTNCTSQAGQMPYTGTEGIWVLPFLTQNKNSDETQRILRTWGSVFRTPGFVPYMPAVSQNCSNSDQAGQTTTVKYLPSTSSTSTVERLWGPRGLNSVSEFTFSQTK